MKINQKTLRLDGPEYAWDWFRFLCHVGRIVKVKNMENKAIRLHYHLPSKKEVSWYIDEVEKRAITGTKAPWERKQKCRTTGGK
jgi:hypothetical protein